MPTGPVDGWRDLAGPAFAAAVAASVVAPAIAGRDSSRQGIADSRHCCRRLVAAAVAVVG